VAIADRITLGAPGIYVRSSERVRALTGVPMDVCAFVGVAPRGPCRVPVPDRHRPDAPWSRDTEAPPLRSVAVPVESWDEYRRLFGSFEGSGLLPYAVASFFEQGGRRAYVVRIVHDYSKRNRNEVGAASAILPGVRTAAHRRIRLSASNEGVWGNALRATLSFTVRPVGALPLTAAELTMPADSLLPVGTLLRLTLAGGVRQLRFVSSIREVRHPADSSSGLRLTLDRPAAGPALAVEAVTGILDVEDADPALARAERHEELGLSSDHPRWIAGVLTLESDLLRSLPAWADLELLPEDPNLVALTTRPFQRGRDRSGDITPEDFFDPEWLPGDEQPGSGIHALVETADVSTLVVPDLYSPEPLPEVDDVADPLTLAGPCFAVCVDIAPPGPQEPHPVALAGLRLDPTLPDDLRRIVDYQQRVVTLADLLETFVVLLDVPPRLTHRQVLRWRDNFASSYAVAYHPWLLVAEISDERSKLIPLAPSAVAAGIVARREHQYGVPYGPANELGTGVIDVADRIAPAWHDELHQNGINVYLRERDGVRLTAARTLSRQPDYRQLSVRRLITMLRRVLQEQFQWMVFEPNGPSLWASVRFMLNGFLGQLWDSGALTGASEDEAFYVRCDESLNTQSVLDAGQLLVEVGVAPAEPLEFIVIRFSRDGDGTLRVEGRRG
jgi:hypothetical protein